MARKSKSRKCKRSQKRVKSYIKRSGKKVRSFCRRKSNRKSRSIKRRGPSRKKCPPNKKAVRSYRKKSGKRVKSYCRKLYDYVPMLGTGSGLVLPTSYKESSIFKVSVPIVKKQDETFDLPVLLNKETKPLSISESMLSIFKSKPKSENQKRLEDKSREEPEKFTVNLRNCLSTYGLQEGKYNPNDVNKNFRKLALRWHPDKIKGGDSPYYFRDVVEPCKAELLRL